MKHPKGFLSTVQQYVAVTAIGPSSLRNQGASGVIDTAREFLTNLDLNDFVVKQRAGFDTVLDSKTNRLRKDFPKKAQNWGAARKAINLFLRDSLYNRYLAERYQLDIIEPWLEIPLDSKVAKGLMRESRKLKIPIKSPVWPGIKNLSIEVSSQFQSLANEIARKKGLARIHLDIHLWLEER
ncbi:MAG: hypothetical protein NTU60_09635 [Candidatus Aminicenantes bacterium]|nr:hypothetical protein [Candidatus Aminicenantes bacterium]